MIESSVIEECLESGYQRGFFRSSNGDEFLVNCCIWRGDGTYNFMAYVSKTHQTGEFKVVDTSGRTLVSQPMTDYWAKRYCQKFD